ncbi:2Fe-2S iron-sulfur cluster-binding protein (plasmid) [Burkholderia vietnamiensis]
MNAIERTAAAMRDAPDRFADTAFWERGGVPWPSNERQTLTCCRVIDETRDVKSFEFRTGEGLPVCFEPGQFLTVSANVNGHAVERCYTISSPPTRPWLLSITVKRVPGGMMSNWLHDNMKPGNPLLAYGPSGAFTPTGSRAAKSLYLSAGSGVTPLMSMTRASVDLGLDRDIAFVHSARTPADIIFCDELKRLARLSPRLRLFFICEGAWTGETGRLSLPLLARWIPDFAGREVYTCGPAGYMSAVRALLREGGHDPARYHQESFDIGADAGAVQPAAQATDAVSQQTYTVRLSRSGRAFTMNATETVLAAAKKAGVAVPSSCSQGVCGTCKTKLLEGSVDMQHNGGIRDREVVKGLRLLCCSRPTSDLVLEL